MRSSLCSKQSAPSQCEWVRQATWADAKAATTRIAASIPPFVQILHLLIVPIIILASRS